MSAFITIIVTFLETVQKRVNSNEKGATMVEYGIMVAFIAVVVMAAVIVLGPKVAELFTQVSTAI
ncbi:Flp/Fap pilin component [Pseudarthrobacter phenanthrenivorans Sphe3]|uniref:Flp/Fap pilin component n=1 Tax=Pseudarthrobacter phenanthrenivorans (strain DSM 18606 / JCM 16027 / LMG 23796 / Sphe3) TaxID=930171 RepID=F0M9V3_PSEPM|nr:Flp family type IVb pilin [Pseudarthrobacter phenanthrenivorans]ADX73883.1 Flp/Fap pilin component [Pseudarthrobacter phenanthrenivorans Sphe3]